MGMRCEQTANEKLSKDCAFVKGDEFPCFPPPAYFNSLSKLGLPLPSTYILHVRVYATKIS